MSGLEPLAALGLVCNIVQLVEVGFKTATLCKNAYRTGEPDPELSVYAQNLAVAASRLSQSLEHSQHPLSLDDARLLTLARNCRDAEAEWRKKTPARFLSQQQPRKRDRFGAVFRGIVNKPEIDRLESQLQKAKESLETDLLVGAFKRLEISKVQADDLRETLQNLLVVASTSETKLQNLIQGQVSLVNTQLSDRIDRAESSTKAHITLELGNHESRIISNADKGKDSLLAEAEAREASRREYEAYERLLRSFHYPDMNHRKKRDTFLSRVDIPLDIRTRQFRCPSSKASAWWWARPRCPRAGLRHLCQMARISREPQWQPDVQILAHFFWKVGSPMQSSFKGFFCSLAYQLFVSDKGTVIGWLQKHPDWSRKAGPGDWDNNDLQSLVTSLLGLSAKPFCLFIDGLDELMDDDGVCTLIGFLDTLQISSPLVKICMSSRPEQAIRLRLCREPDLKMQDLTWLDIQRYVRATLGNAVGLVSSSIVVEDLVRDITNRAEGVFLWAVLVTRSVARGILNGDSKEDIRQRLDKTPRKLHELYFDMWARLGEDSDLYQESTALILKIALFAWRPPRLETLSPRISILEMMVASSHDLWSMPVNDFVTLRATDLVQRCSELCTRIPTRTGGLFEVIRSHIIHPTEEQMADESFSHLLKYDKLQVQPIHRTVFDFLSETDDGKTIMEYHKASQEELFIRIFRSCLLRECLWPEVYFAGCQYWMQIQDEDRKYCEADDRLELHLHSLLSSTSTIKVSTLTELLDFIWTFLVERTRGFSWQADTRISSRVPRTKLEFLLRIASMGFDTYVGKYLQEWESKRQFDLLDQVLLVCLRSPYKSYGRFGLAEWASGQRRIEYILKVILSTDEPWVSLPKAPHISNNTVAKTAIACFLVSSINVSLAIRFHAEYSWDSDMISTTIRIINDFRHVVCFDDRLLVTLYPTGNRWDPLNLLNCRRHHQDEETVYVEISVSTLVQIFLRYVRQYDATFDCQDVEEALDLKLFSQTINPIMIGMQEGLFPIPSMEDQDIVQKICQVLLQPGPPSSSSCESEDLDCYPERGAESWSDISRRICLTGTQVEIPNAIEERIGQDWMNLYLCGSCEAREATQG
ncbi:NACHT domain-containing protein [Fusarium napiforme]|uniref:NACHT domain-containing protein n=1 Tax=Fusarium napiforme TaxID=42672 RepID=A0A8H5J1D4_9HYPO|nr:NACHT domain-containing protein [Fusarium napiforme]